MDIEPMAVWALLLRGVAIGALAATLAALWRNGQPSIRLAGLLLTLSAASYVLNSSAFTRDQLGPLTIPVHFMALGGAGCFWLFIVTVFEDRPVSPLTLIPAGVLTALGLVGWLGRQGMSSPVWISHNLILIL